MKTGVIDFVSESMRKFACRQLHDFKEDVTNLLIDDLLKDADSNLALDHLPDYYEQAGRLEELLDYLTPEHFSRVLEHSQSLYPVRRRAEMGLMASRKLNQDKALMRFSMQKSVIIELERAEIWRSEIEALMALKDYDSALALAQTTVLKEDRLHLLAIIAKMKRKEGLVPETELLEQIYLLYKQINPKSLGRRATEIASDLMWFNPDLAIELIDTAINMQEDEQKNDWAFTKLSILALAANHAETLSSDIVEKTQSKIRDPKLHKFSQAVSVFFGDFSATEVIARTEKLEMRHRLFFIRNWALVNQDKEKAADVIDYALDLLIKNTAYTPKTRDLREIAAPLPFVSDKTQARQLVGRFDSHKGAIENLGTTVDYVRLQLLLAQTESKCDFDAAYNRVLEVYWYIAEIDELSTKTECLAWVVSTLNEIDPQGLLEANEGMSTVTEEELKSNLEELLNTTASHYYGTKEIIKALSISKPEIALEIAQYLNTSIRRDLATLEFIKSAIEAPLNKIDLILIQKAINKIDDLDVKDEALIRVIERFSEVNETENTELIKRTIPILDSINEISSAYLRCKACCFAHNFLNARDYDKYNTFLSSLSKRLEQAWNVLDAGWLKVDTGFRITETFAVTAPEMANRYLKYTEQLKDEIVIDAEKPALTYLACLKLSIRAFGGMLPSKINTSVDMERLTRLVDFIPSAVERSALWGDLALLCFMNKHSDEGKRIVLNHIKPLLTDICDHGDKYQVLIKTAPALYFAHSKTAIEMILQMPECKRDEAFSEICDFILRQCLPSDPYESIRGSGYLLTYEEAVDICELLNLMTTDAIIYKYIEEISSSLSLKQNKYRFTDQQKTDIADRIEKIVSHKFPDQKNIKHDGFKIVALAHAAHIRRAKPSVWNDLIESGYGIPNIADSAYTLCIIAVVMPAKLRSKRDEIIGEAINLVQNMKSDFDRAERFEDLADILINVDERLSRKCLKSGIETSLTLSDPDLIYPTQRRIIDLAHKIEPSFAESLADLVDTDPARRSAKYDLKNHLDVLKLKNEMSEQKEFEIDSSKPKSMYSKAAWMNLGALNSGRMTPIHFKHLIPYIIAAGELPLSESYPIIAWAIENVVKRLAKTDQARTHIIPIFESTLLGAELASRIALRSSVQLKKIKTQVIQTSEISANVIIKAGERQKAIQFIKDWLTNEVQDFLIICDSYFGIEDLEILQILVSISPKCNVTILTSKKKQQQENLQQPWDEAFRSHWRRISDQSPPDTDVVIVGLESSGALPIHDRWWLATNSGLRFGTSFNSLGINSISDISILSPEEAESRGNEVKQYINREKRNYNNEKLTYNLFSL